jgi:hypothetical protein
MRLIKGLMSSAAVAAIAVAFLAAPSSASTIVYNDTVDTLPATNPPGSNGLQQWVGNLGMEFQVNSAIVVSSLGAFDDGNHNTLVGTTGSGVVVGIFNVSTGQLVGTTVTFSSESPGTQIGADSFKNVTTPFTLVKGDYEIVALNDPNYNQGYFNTGPNQFQTLNNLGGALSFIGGSFFDSNSGLDLPMGIDTGPANRYDAGTFAADLATPLPATWTMLIAGFVGLGFFANRGSRKNAAALAA